MKARQHDFRPPRPTETFKEQEAASLAADIAAFQARGGTIQKLEWGDRSEPVNAKRPRGAAKKPLNDSFESKATKLAKKRASDEEE